MSKTDLAIYRMGKVKEEAIPFFCCKDSSFLD